MDAAHLTVGRELPMQESDVGFELAVACHPHFAVLQSLRGVGQLFVDESLVEIEDGFLAGGFLHHVNPCEHFAEEFVASSHGCNLCRRGFHVQDGWESGAGESRVPEEPACLFASTRFDAEEMIGAGGDAPFARFSEVCEIIVTLDARALRRFDIDKRDGIAHVSFHPLVLAESDDAEVVPVDGADDFAFICATPHSILFREFMLVARDVDAVDAVFGEDEPLAFETASVPGSDADAVVVGAVESCAVSPSLVSFSGIETGGVMEHALALRLERSIGERADVGSLSQRGASFNQGVCLPVSDIDSGVGAREPSVALTQSFGRDLPEEDVSVFIYLPLALRCRRRERSHGRFFSIKEIHHESAEVPQPPNAPEMSVGEDRSERVRGDAPSFHP